MRQCQTKGCKHYCMMWRLTRDRTFVKVGVMNIFSGRIYLDLYTDISLCIKAIMTFFIMCYAIKLIEGLIVFDVQHGKGTSISAFRRPSLTASDRELLETSMITRAPPIWNPTMFIAKPSCNSNVLSPWIIHQKEEVKWNWKFDFFYIVSWEKRKKLLPRGRHKEDQLQWIKLRGNHCYWN